jgi:Uma2 family endonuclease
MSVLLTEAPTDEPEPYRVSVDQFLRMDKAGAFHPEDRVELVNGVLVKMSPIGLGHARAVRRLTNAFARHLGDRAIVSCQNPLHCNDESLPQPDIVIIQGPESRYDKRHPGAGDALVVVEVADSSLRFDQKVKVPLCARVGIPEAWVIDLRHQRVHVYTDPVPDGAKRGRYVVTTVLTSTDTLVPTAFPDVKIPIGDLGLGSR